MKAKKINISLFLLPALILFALIFAYPLVTIFSTSLFEWRGFSGNMTFIGFENFRNMLGDRIFLRAFRNTLVWVFLQSTVHVALGVIIALMLARKAKGWKTVRTVYMFSNIISMAVLAVVYMNFFNPQYGLVNSLIRLIGPDDFSINWYFQANTSFWTVTATWLLFSGLITILVLAEISAIPDELYEVAAIDGASRLKTDLYITLPLLRNVIGIAVVLASSSMLKEFELIYLTTNGGPDILTMNLPLHIYKTALLENNYGYANALAVVTVLLGFAVILLANRLFRMGQSSED